MYSHFDIYLSSLPSKNVFGNHNPNRDLYGLGNFEAEFFVYIFSSYNGFHKNKYSDIYPPDSRGSQLGNHLVDGLQQRLIPSIRNVSS